MLVSRLAFLFFDPDFEFTVEVVGDGDLLLPWHALSTQRHEHLGLLTRLDFTGLLIHDTFLRLSIHLEKLLSVNQLLLDRQLVHGIVVEDLEGARMFISVLGEERRVFGHAVLDHRLYCFLPKRNCRLRIESLVSLRILV